MALIDNDYNISLNDTEYLNSQPEYQPKNDAQILQSYYKPKRNKVNGNNLTKSSIDNLVVKRIGNVEAYSNKTALQTSLSSWGLPENILSKYKERGISDMFMWQVECLGNNKVLEHRNNLVYSAPTSAGKTLVAEILALKTLLEKQKKVIIILPFVSVVREKMFYFQDILSSSGIRVEGFMGSHSPPGGFKAVQLAICTIEKANSIVNKLLEEKTLSDVGAVIIDEMHLLGDPSRGYLLELLLTKLQYMATRCEIIIQLIGMSATLPNLDLLSKWLSAELYTTNFRPIPLQEYCLVAKEIFDTKFQLYRHLKSIPDLVEDTDNILQLCLETISNSCSVLIFCPTKNWCENLAQQISVAFWKLGKSKSQFGQCLREQLKGNIISEVLEQLKHCPVGLDSVLKKTVSFGVAFHHAGLTMDERDIIESAFRNGALRVLVATSTLSSGVNLPAQRVIVRTPMFHGKPIDSLTYRQMIGRAGRMGKDTSGESILVCQKNDKRIAEELMSAQLHPIESCLEGAGKLKRAILEVIASGVATTPDDVNLFTNCTLLAASMDGNVGINNPIEKSVDFLIKNEFIRLQKNEKDELKYVATNLAKACLSSSLPPEDGLALFEEIEKARQCFVLDSDLHLLYLVTPYSVCSQWSNLDWMLYLEIWERLSPSMRRVAELVGVQESFIFNATRGRINTSTSKQYHRLQIHRRFYTALALQDLVNEIPLNQVANKFQCNRGMLQSLQQSASMFAGMVTSFCSQLGWKNIEILVSQFQDRLQFGIQHELLDLMKLSNLNGQRARALYNAGIESLADLASLDICKLENILLSSVPFESEKEREGETAYDVEQKRKIRGIFITGKHGLTARDAAEMLIKDARKYLQLEIGAAILKWDTTETNIDSNLSSSSCYSSSSDFEKDTETKKKENNIINEKNLKNESKLQINKINIQQSNTESSSCISKSNKTNNSINIKNVEFFEEIRDTLNNNAKNESTPKSTNISHNKLVTKSEYISTNLPQINTKNYKPEKNEIYTTLQNNFLISPCSEDSVIVCNSEQISPNNVQVIKLVKENFNSITKFESEENLFDESNSDSLDYLSKSEQDYCLNLKTDTKIYEPETPAETDFELFENNSLKSTNSEHSELKQSNDEHLDKIVNSLFDLKSSNVSDNDGVSDNDDVVSTITSENNSIIDSLLDVSKLSNNSDYSFTLNISEDEAVIDNKNDACNWTSFEIPSFSINSDLKSQSIRTPLNELSLNKSSNSSSYQSDASLFGESLCIDSKIYNELDLDDVTNKSNSNKKSEEIMENPSFFNISKAFSDNDMFSEDIFSSEDIENTAKEENVSDVVETSQTDITECSNYNSVKKIKKKSKKQSSKRNRSNEEINTPSKKLKYNSEPSNIENNSDNMKYTSVESIDLTSLNIIEVCRNALLFDTFSKEVAKKSEISFAIACEQIKIDKPLIGQNILQPSTSKQIMNNENHQIFYEDKLITGVAVTFGGNTVYFISFLNEKIIENKEKLKFLQHILHKSNLNVRIFDYKEHAKILYRSCKIEILSNVEDPKMADWLLEPEGKEKNLSSMALKYSPEAVGIAQLAGNCKGVGSVALDLTSAILSKIRASVEALVTWHIIEFQRDALAVQDEKLLQTFKIEMKSLACLARMELTGLNVDQQKMNTLINLIQEQATILQQHAFSLVGRRFSFTSSKEVSKVLGLYKGKRVSTNKQTLEQSTHPIASIILQWRKLNCTLTKMIYPIIRSLKNNRIHGICVTHSSTGRISMHEPNLQNVPRNFEIIKLDKTVIPLSVRASFIPSHGKIFLSADYCQLELRLLAHLSRDSILRNIMRKEGDVFKLIAAKLNKISEREVTDPLRQRAKQLCYGVIYGMGAKALSEQLGSTEDEANEFTNSFKNTYPKIKDFIQYTIDQCKQHGFVKTLAGRRRYLPHINHDNIAVRSQAERQAVNTTIQGSAADLAKNAMVLIDEELHKFYSINLIKESKSSLVLHLHDELLYEVPFTDLNAIAKIVKNTMENSVKLSIPFPVKVKSGQSWGDLKELAF